VPGQAGIHPSELLHCGESHTAYSSHTCVVHTNSNGSAHVPAVVLEHFVASCTVIMLSKLCEMGSDMFISEMLTVAERYR
jgi:hypothetical protein